MFRITYQGGHVEKTRSVDKALRAIDAGALVEIKINGAWRRSGLMPPQE